MKKKLPEDFERYKFNHPMYGKSDFRSPEGAFIIPMGKKRLRVISGTGFGWDHVSVSLKHRCPTWDEMCFIKNIFFKPDELVLQFHPPKKDYKNLHPFCLHLWRPWNQEIILPPDEFI